MRTAVDSGGSVFNAPVPARAGLRLALASFALAGLLLTHGARNAYAIGIMPQNGHVYPTGTVIRGRCVPGSWWSKLEIWNGSRWAYLMEVGDLGTQGEPSDPHWCSNRLANPGHYRLVYYLDPTENVIATFTISPEVQDPCTSDETEIVSVGTPNGKRPSADIAALKGTHLAPNQTVAAEDWVEMTMGDGSLIRMEPGSTLRMTSCSWLNHETTDWKTTLNLTLGKVWAKVTRRFGPSDIEINTERVVNGVRGTEYWVSYDPSTKLTTVHVLSGSIWTRANGVTIDLGPGQTATQQGSHAPVLQGGPTPPAPKPPAGTLLDVSGANDLDKTTSAFTVQGPFTIESTWSPLPGKKADALFGLNLHDSTGQTSVPFDARMGSGSNSVVENANCSHGCRLEIDAENMKYHVRVVKHG